MNYVVLLFSVALLATAIGAVLHGNHDKNSIDSGAIFEDLHLIGTADGVTYFYENSTVKAWDGAGKYCQSSGMQLASINTQNQLDMLNSTAFDKYCYWTAGRDAEQIQQFTWNRTNLAFPNFLNGVFVSQPNYRSCIYLNNQLGRITLHSYDCKAIGCKALCST